MTPELQVADEGLQRYRTAPLSESATTEWSFAARVVLGFFCGYTLLVWLPWTLALLARLPMWWFDAIGRWPIAWLGLPEHFAPTRMATNYLPLYLATMVLAAVALIAAVVWARLTRGRPSPERTFVRLHTGVRFMLAALLCTYGWHKVLPAQFGRLATGAGTDYLIHQVGQLPPSDLLWAFMEGSRSYQVFTGTTELAAGLLLLTRRTAMPGALLAVMAMTQVFALNIGYDVPVKFVAGQLFFMSLFVVAPHARRFADGVLGRATSAVRNRPIFARADLDRVARAAGLLPAGVIVLWSLHLAWSQVEANRAIPRTPLHGIWDVEEVTRNGVQVPLTITDRTLWRRLVLPWDGTQAGAIVVWMSDAVTRCRSAIDVSARTIELEALPDDSTVAGSIHGVPERMGTVRFGFDHAGDERLVLHQRTGQGDAVTIRLRRFDPEAYLLRSYRPRWQW